MGDDEPLGIAVGAARPHITPDFEIPPVHALTSFVIHERAILHRGEPSFTPARLDFADSKLIWNEA